jgi:phage tail sheath protein FI
VATLISKGSEQDQKTRGLYIKPRVFFCLILLGDFNMPVSLSYPGVYLEEIASGVRTIAGASTSVTAFVGRSLKGPMNQPITVNSYADFERVFGGLWQDNALGYAVFDFYQNGGSQSVVVRVHNEAKIAEVKTAATNGITFVAASEGAWGNNLRVSIDHAVSAEVASRLGLAASDLFNLTVRDVITGTVEKFNNLTVKASAQQIDKVLANNSNLLKVKDGTTLPSAIPAATDNAETEEAIEELALIDGDDGDALEADSFIGEGSQANKTGLYTLEKTDLFNLLCIPGYDSSFDLDSTVLVAASSYCEKRNAFLIVSSPSSWTNKDAAKTGITSLGISSKNAAVFFPRVIKPNPLRNNQLDTFDPCGMIAGTIARIDGQRGIWKAPAGLEASLSGVTQLSVALTDAENGELNKLGVNCLRMMPAVGAVIWGARTLQGNDLLGSEWKYIPVRRMSLHIQNSLYRGTQWAVFEPNSETLWRQLSLNIDSFMNDLFRQGAFKGLTKKEAYFVKCDSETTTQSDINQGLVNIVVGFAPLKPAEFVVIKIQQLTNQQ